MNKLFEFLKDLELPGDDFAIFGSAPLAVRNIIPSVNDLDVICRRAAWEKVKETGSLRLNDDYGVEIITLLDGKVTFGNKWGIGEFDIDELIESADIVNGLPFVKVHHVIAYKKVRRSEKDLRHIELVRESEYFDLVEAGG